MTLGSFKMSQACSESITDGWTNRWTTLSRHLQSVCSPDEKVVTLFFKTERLQTKEKRVTEWFCSQVNTDQRIEREKKKKERTISLGSGTVCVSSSWQEICSRWNVAPASRGGGPARRESWCNRGETVPGPCKWDLLQLHCSEEH